MYWGRVVLLRCSQIHGTYSLDRPGGSQLLELLHQQYLAIVLVQT